jgi:3-hydroxyisobutyrate dehydrogenase-like beta-hydroxyacid dehydrogenase
MVARLVDAGHHVAALGRYAEKRAPLARLGAEAVREISAVSAHPEQVVVCLFTERKRVGE